jgi:nitrogen regulatory protein PII
MKAIMLVTDSEVMREYERALVGEGHHGFTVVPAVEGRGRHGLKTGDRIHPGGSSLLLTVVGEDDAPPLLSALRRVRDGQGYGEVTRIWTFAAEEVA